MQMKALHHLETISVSEDHSSRTSVTLLSRLRQEPRNQAAWNDFVGRYEPKILQWCRGWKLQESDARDVAQDVLLKLHRLLAKFAYDPSRSFRGWLKTLTHHAWRDVVAERNRGGIGSGDSRMRELFENIQAGDDLDKHLEEEFHRELMEQAMVLVRPRVTPRTWDAFRLTALEGWSGATAADHLEINITGVYKAKWAVKKMIREEIRKLVQIE
jgi:RNA polymerase sigma factor (sigma-70 family)